MSAPHSQATSSAVSVAESVEEAIASTGLEGLELSPEFLADAQLLAEGKIDSAEFRARTIARHRS